MTSKQGSKRRFQWALLVASLAVLGCQAVRSRGAARVLQFTPANAEVDDADLGGGLRAVFDRPVSPPGAAGQVVAAAFRISPPLEGEARWLDARTLAFFPRGKLLPSTTYEVELDRALVTAADVSLGRWQGARFIHQRIALEALTFTGPRQFQSRTPVVTLRATQAVRPADAVVACAFFVRRPDGTLGTRTPSREAQVRAEDEEAPGTEGASRLLRLRPASPLAAGTEYLFRCDQRFRPARGGEGLAAPRDGRFTTVGLARIERMAPAGSDVSADEVRVEIVFATPMDPTQVRRHVRLELASGGTVPLELAGDATATTFSWSGDLEPGSGYELVVEPGLKDALGQPVEPRTQSFAVGDAAPRLRMDRGIHVVERAQGRYPIWTRNLSAFHVRCAVVPEEKLVRVLTGPMNYDAWWDASGGAPDYAGLGLAPRERDVTTAPGYNRWVDASLPLRSTCGGGPTGVYLLEVKATLRRGETEQRALASVTDLGLLAKVGNASSLVWVVRLSTGQPVAEVVVKVRDLQGQVRFTGKTNRDGVLLAPGATTLLGVQPRDDGGEWEEIRARRVIITAQAGGDLAVLDTNWNNGIQIWNYGVEQDRRGGTDRIRGFLHSDRGLYRPGDTVHLRGLVRRIDLAGRMSVPRQRQIHVIIEDPHQTTLIDTELQVSQFGGFSRDLSLSDDARLGDYTVRAEIDGQRFSERFAVEEYRPRTFEVKVATPSKNVFFGQRLQFSLAASYLHGSPLHAAKVTWSVRRRAHLPEFPGFDGYSFQDLAALWDQGRWWAAHEERSFSSPVADGQIELDAAGKAVVTTADVTRDLAGPQDYLFEATVEDPTGQAVTATQVVAGHKANLYLGLHASEWVQAVDMPFGVQVVAFDAEGKRRPAQARLTLLRRDYQCQGSTDGLCHRVDSGRAAIDRAVVVPSAGSASVERVVLREPGEYLIQVTAPDGRGNEALSTETIYVVGKGEAFWSGDEGDRMTVIASKSRYRPGETARLVPQAQMPGARALVTLERDGVLSYRVQSLATSGESIDVAIEPRLAPNVFASVALVRGRTGEGDAGRPRFRMGLVNLVVDSAEKRLSVAVETDRPSYEPGDLVKARVRVTGSDGAPVRGELALAVADEGVLQIVGFRTPDPMPVFYAPWGLGVESATTWNRLLLSHAPDVDDPEEGGDGGGDEAGRIRSRFMATAFWAPALVTDAGGRVEITFRAPDNLTAFRVMAVVADGGERFGSGERRFTVRKPLQAVPALPRFLSVGDQVRAAVVLHNNTERPLSVVASVSIQGATLVGDSAQTVVVPSGGLRPVTFPVAVSAAGEAVFTFRASGGGFRDAVEAKLPVHAPGSIEVLAVGEGVASGRVQHAVPALGAVVPGSGALELSLDVTGLGRLEEGLRYLVGYPHGCLEQTTSKVVPMIALTELAKAIDLEGADAGNARVFVEAGIAKILRHQHDDGGFGLWPGTPPEVHYTAYGLWGLQVARAAGYQVDSAALDRGARYLQTHASIEGASAGETIGQGGAAAFAAYVLAALGHPDPARMTTLYERRQQLPIYGRAFLTRALAAGGRPDLAAALAGELTALITRPGPAILHEGETDLGWYWSSDGRSTALVLSALLEVTPRHPAVAQLADGLLSARRGGRWASTQENLYSLLALAELARVRTQGEARATVSVGGQVIGRPVVKGRAVHLTAPVAGLGAGALVIEVEGAPLYYVARLRLGRAAGDVVPADHGVAIERVYLDPQTGAPLTSLRLGQVARVRVTVRAKDRQSHVAVIDHLPAGVEPVLTRFAPTVAESSGPRGSLWWGQWQTAWQQEELHDDRAALFADVLAAGESQREYLVRAIAAGTFTAPPATVEAMYRPEVRGQSPAAIVQVLP